MELASCHLLGDWLAWPCSSGSCYCEAYRLFISQILLSCFSLLQYMLRVLRLPCLLLSILLFTRTFGLRLLFSIETYRFYRSICHLLIDLLVYLTRT